MLQQEPRPQEHEREPHEHRVSDESVTVNRQHCEERERQGHGVTVQRVVPLLPAGISEERQVHLESIDQGEGEAEESVEAVTEGAVGLVAF